MYSRYSITVSGNDIDDRWEKYYPEGRWIIGDALKINWSSFDAVVFAPPLTHGCSGKREDSLMVNEVSPRYTDFLGSHFNGIKVMVLPARSIATSSDRKEMHKLLASVYAEQKEVSVIPLLAGKRGIRKYVDVYIY
jgi:hypothetical protein